jgi:hypothetical protein
MAHNHRPGSDCRTQDAVVLVRFANIERMKLMYAPELSKLPDASRSQLLIALAALTSFESWDQMRHCHGLLVKMRKMFGDPQSTGCCQAAFVPQSPPSQALNSASLPIDR